MIPELRSRGFAPEILWEPSTPNEFPTEIDANSLLRDRAPDVVVFQKIRGPAVVNVVRALRERNIRTVWSVCDVVDEEMVVETDATIAVTEYLRDLYPQALQDKIHVVHDGIEDESLIALSVAKSDRPPSALLITSDELWALPVIGRAPKRWRVHVVGRYPSSVARRIQRAYWALRRPTTAHNLPMLLKALCDPRIERTSWSPSALAQAVEGTQIGIIPIDKTDFPRAYGCAEPAWRIKSENRITLLMAAGLPVIASPIPSYEKVVENGYNGFFADSAADWHRLFDRLRDAGLRQEIGERARRSVLPKFSRDLQAQRFVRVLQHVLR